MGSSEEFIDDDSIEYGLASGEVVAGEELDSLGDAFASGEYHPKIIRPRGRPLLGDAPSKILQVRLDPELAEKLSTRAGEEHKSNSEIMRQALTKYLAS